MSLITLIPPATELFEIADARFQCREDSTEQDDVIARHIAMSRGEIEDFLRRRLIRQTVQLRISALGSFIRIPCAPILSVTSIQYLDAAGILTTLAANQYRLIQSQEPNLIIPATGVTWPTVLTEPDSVQVTFVAGYGDATNVPPQIVGAALLLTAYRYEHREAVITGVSAMELPHGVKELLTPHILWV